MSASSSSNSSSINSNSNSDPVHRNFFDRYVTSEDNNALDESETTKSIANENGVSVAFPSSPSSTSSSSPLSPSDSLCSYISSSVLGRSDLLNTPFGFRPILHADHTASSKSLSFIENYITTEILPLYANTHTTTNTTGLQTTLLRREAREIIHRSVKGSKDDVVLFTGSGSTAAISLFIHLLQLSHRISTLRHKVVVLLGPYEHHSNILPWRELKATVYMIKENEREGGVDMKDLEEKLKKAKEEEKADVVIGSFSAASNVNGIMSDTIAITSLLSKYQALSLFDYASAAPYVAIDMNPMNQDALAKSAIVISPHKFIGGPSTPGILVIKKALCHQFSPAPSSSSSCSSSVSPYYPGGGTVFFVNSERHRYLENFEEREEGGTPDIVAAIRAGLVFQLKEQMGVREIERREEMWRERAMKRWGEHSDVIQLMGNPIPTSSSSSSSTSACVGRLPIFSFLIRHFPSNYYLHSSFVSVLLNDLFGIQSRSGCLCAGPYAQTLLGLSLPVANQFENIMIAEKNELLRPGFVRVNFHWSITEEEADYLIEAVIWIANHGWKLLPLYGFYVDSGEFKHRNRMTKFVNRKWINQISYSSGVMKFPVMSEIIKQQAKQAGHKEVKSLKEYIQKADQVLEKAVETIRKQNIVNQEAFLTPAAKQLRWFLLPSEAAAYIKSSSSSGSVSSFLSSSNPIRPPTYIINDGQVVDVIDNSFKTWNEVTNGKQEEEKEMDGNAEAAGVVIETKMEEEEEEEGLTEKTEIQDPKLKAELLELKSAIVSSSSSSNSSPSTESNSVARVKRNAGTPDKEREVKRQHTDKPKPTSVPNSSSSSSTSSSSSSELPICKNCFHTHWASNDSATQSKLSTFSLVKECASCPCNHFLPRVRSSQKEVFSLEKKLRSLVGRAILDYNMIQSGDRVLVGVSGGKDSLTLINILIELRKKSPVKFDIGAVTVDPQTPEYDPSSLKVYFASLNIPYFYESQPILAQAKSCMIDNNSSKNGGTGSEESAKYKVSICSYCARMKRGILYNCLRREKYNILALGQHSDDLCESLLMSLMHNGMLRTMKAAYEIAAKDIKVIRPLIYVRERLTREYAAVADLPVIMETCPACFEAPKERARIKLLLASQEHLHPHLIPNMLQAMKPLMKIKSATGRVQALEEVEAGGKDDEDEEDEFIELKGNAGVNGDGTCPLPNKSSSSSDSSDNSTKANKRPNNQQRSKQNQRQQQKPQQEQKPQQPNSESK